MTENEDKGQPHFKVFWNYNYDFSDDVQQNSAFELKRVYLGYKYKFDEKISAKITYDIGKNDAGSNYTAFVKIAQLDYKLSSKVKLSMGMIGGKQFNDQEKVWGYRYIYKTLQDENKFGSSADLGVNAEIKLSDKLTTNIFALNGEGYKNLQDFDGNQRVGLNLIYAVSDSVNLKFYYDTQESANSESLNNIGLFAGYKSGSYSIGAEYNKMENGTTYKTPIDNHNLDGISIYNRYSINDKYEVFARFDQISSNTLDGATNSWNYDDDGSLIIIGTQYKANDGVKFSLNARSFSYENLDTNLFEVFFNVEFKL
tara:strand:- start:790 stop:1728 length:939 start_codon:yes stop_codon:yes gene_type:complete